VHLFLDRCSTISENSLINTLEEVSNMSELVKVIAESLDRLADKSATLTPMLAVIGVIIALVVLGLVVAKGGR
jgi:hypothetical protein